MPCRPPVTCWTYCCKRIPAQALAPPPQALGRLGLGHSPLDRMGVAHLEVAHLEVAQVSNLLIYATFLKTLITQTHQYSPLCHYKPV